MGEDNLDTAIFTIDGLINENAVDNQYHVEQLNDVIERLQDEKKLRRKLIAFVQWVAEIEIAYPDEVDFSFDLAQERALELLKEV